LDKHKMGTMCFDQWGQVQEAYKNLLFRTYILELSKNLDITAPPMVDIYDF